MLSIRKIQCSKPAHIFSFHTLRVTAEFNAVRLDRFLDRKFEIPKALIQKLLRTKKVCIIGEEKKTKGKIPPGFRLYENDVIQINSELEERVDKEPETTQNDQELAEELKRNIQYRSKTLLIIDKPSGIAVQGGTNTPNHINKVLSALRFDDCPETPRIVHRLDKGTSGLLILARTRQAAIQLAQQFRENQIKKEYLAIVIGSTSTTTGNGRIVREISTVAGSSYDYRTIRNDPGCLSQCVPAQFTKTQSAITEFQVLARSKQQPYLSLLKLSPQTGRKHQLRIHCAQALKVPILGDSRYGQGVPKGLACDSNTYHKLYLHMHKVTIPNAPNPITVKAPIPKHFLHILKQHFDDLSTLAFI